MLQLPKRFQGYQDVCTDVFGSLPSLYDQELGCDNNIRLMVNIFKTKNAQGWCTSYLSRPATGKLSIIRIGGMLTEKIVETMTA